MLAEPSSDDRPDLIVDLCGNEPGDGKGRTLRVLYDGMAGESVLVGALVAGRMPTIEIADARTGEVIARGVACADNAQTISDALECVLGRVVTLVISAARGWTTLAQERRSVPQALRLRAIVALELKQLAASIVRRLYRLCFYNPHWRTCWRFIDGPDLWETRSLSGTSWNVIPDPGFRFYADPFPLVHEGKTYVFVEDFDHKTAKAIISVLPFDEQGPIGPPQPVLEEPWHLSYPFVFAHAGQIWMIPEHRGQEHRSTGQTPFRIAGSGGDPCLEDRKPRRDRHSPWRLFLDVCGGRSGAVSWSARVDFLRARPARSVAAIRSIGSCRSSRRPAGAMFMRGGRPVRTAPRVRNRDWSDGGGAPRPRKIRAKNAWCNTRRRGLAQTPLSYVESRRTDRVYRRIGLLAAQPTGGPFARRMVRTARSAVVASAVRCAPQYQSRSCLPPRWRRGARLLCPCEQQEQKACGLVIRYRRAKRGSRIS